MKERVDFSSSLADRLIGFLAFKRMQGHDYSGNIFRLRHLDAFLSREGSDDGVLHAEVLKRYCDEVAGLCVNSASGYHTVARQFSIYLHAFETRSAVLPARIQPQRSHQICFYPLSEDQIADLMAATDIAGFRCAIRRHCFRFLIGFLYSTGLRISEALALNMQDLDTQHATLFIRRGKFHKERLVAMSSSTFEAMKVWLGQRQQYAGDEASAPLFVVELHKRPDRYQISHAFRRICQRCGIEGDPHPRLHDLRHNYACRCVSQWREQGKDVNALLPILANAMGHVDFHATQLYIHINAASLRDASNKFDAHIRNTLENSK
ncbi:MAG: tyrosine-type recombinase/integrase [Kiritimatiellae bacterium]|jgi:integrase/recombinase XerD|nr:tyrosine-type recombinase/integrase [Kiritimatiellia bacterium]